MYEGEVSVEEIDLAPLLTCARGLGIKGLCEVDSKSDNKVKFISMFTMYDCFFVVSVFW